MYKLKFITQSDFEKHVEETLLVYRDTLKAIDLKKFNTNIIDPIKLIFDKNVFKKDYDEIISLEIHRQREKTNTNQVGYFHQNIFQYIDNCEVPSKGWDIIYRPSTGKNYYCEMKNKHNTMNSSSAAKTYMKMQNHLLKKEFSKNSICALVEIISKSSSDRIWEISLDKEKVYHENIHRMSVDKFYEIVTGDKNAFYDLCMQLPITIEKLIKNNKSFVVEEDTVIDEIKAMNSDMLKSLYLLAFSTYEGFSR